MRFWVVLVWWLALLPVMAAAQTRIDNTATLTARLDGVERVIRSNTVSIDVAATAKRPTRLEFRLLPLGYALQGFSCDATGAVRIAHPAQVDAAALAQAPVVTSLDILQPSIMVLVNPAGNHDPDVRETSYIEVDTGRQMQRIALVETAPDSGVFAGASPAQIPDAERPSDPCFVQIERGDTLTLSFAEDRYSYASADSILVDPAGFVFDSTTTAMVDGATVTLVGLDSKPASVFGDDGKSAYPSTVVTGTAVTDASGRVYPAEHGRYHFPLTPPGQYRLLVVPPPGYTAPSTVDPATLATLRDAAGAPYILNAASFGGSLTLADVDPFYADIPIDPVAAKPSLLLTRTLSLREVAPGDLVEARLLLTNRGTAASGPLHLVDALPAGLRYRAGSLRGAGEPVVTSDGRSLDATLGSLAAGASVELRFILTVPPGARRGEATVRAQAAGPLVTSNVAAAAVRIGPLLFTDTLTIIGQVGEGGCTATPKGVAGVRLLLENGSVVATDRDGLYHLEGVGAGRHVLALDTGSLPPGLEPVDCAHDTTSAGSATTRFVEGVGGSARRVDFRLRRTASAAPTTPLPLPITVPTDAFAAGDRDWLAGRQPGIDWLFPAADHNPRAPVTRVVIQHAPGQRIALTVGGKQVDPLSFDTTDDDGHGIAVSRWVGIPLDPGANRLAARILAEDGHVVATLERTVTVSGPPARAAIDPTYSRLAADGSTPPLVAVRVTDANGRPVRAGTLVPYTVDAPYAAAGDAASDPRDPRVRREQPSAPVVGDDGLAFLPLRPTGQAGAVTLHIGFATDEAVRASTVEAWLTGAARQWTVVGFGAGSLGYDTLSRHARALPLGERGRIADGQLAFYAKGRIRGSWLLTVAYDSQRRLDRDRGLLGQIDPNRWYTVYGDGAVQGNDAATARRLYLRLETRQAYALFGDIETGMSGTQLTRYVRTLTGFKAAYRGERWRAAGFAARVSTLAAHDEIQGNGLTGPYRLRAQGIVPNSDTLRLETRDRYRSERIVASTPLARHLDYEIDAAAGTLRFRAPVLSRDIALNPIFIVADYEVEGGGADRLAAGGRVEHRAGRWAIGAAILHDETRTAVAGVAGVDATLQLATGTVVKVEAATGGDHGIAGGGAAFAGEVEHHRGTLDVTTYARQQAAGFGLGQQNLVEAGTRKLGADLHWIAGEIGLTGTGWYQAMLDGPGERIAGQARIDWHHGPRTLFAGAEIADDHGLQGGDRQSRLLTLGASQVLAGGALTLTGQTQFAPGGVKASIDFPVRHQLQAAWRLSPALRVIGGYELDDGATYRARTVQLGFDLTPWQGARLATTLNDQGVADQGRRFAQYSIAQSLPLGTRWTLDATLDSAMTFSGRIPTTAIVSAFQPVAAGGVLGQDAGDYRAATLGAAYRAGRWSMRGRLEYRRGAVDTRWSANADMIRTLGEGRTLAAGGRAYWVTDANRTTAASTTADVALAWRPPTSHWALLDRLTLRHERGDPAASASGGATLGTSIVLAGGDQLSTRLIDTIALSYRSALDGRGHGIEASVYYGVKYVRGRYDDEVADGLIDATGVDVRQGLGAHLDIGASASVQHAWGDRRWAWSGGPSLGLSPAGDMWMTVGYNVAGYRDRDLADDRYTRAGPYLTVRLKFDAHAVGTAARALGIRR